MKPSKTKTRTSTPHKRDLRRWARWRRNETDEDIAKDERCSTLAVRNSIQRVLAYQQTNSLDIVTARVHEVVLNHLDNVDRVIEDLSRATKCREINEKLVKPDGTIVETKRLVEEIDHRIRRSAIDALKDLREMVASKETKVNVNSGIQVGLLSLGGRSFEDRVRKKREEHGLSMQDQSETEDEQEDDPDDPDVDEAEFEDIPSDSPSQG